MTDETTSPERQREACNREAAVLGIDFGEGDDLREAVDLDVSASKTSPFTRPRLGKWLANPDAFDAIVFWRFDRAIRDMGDMHELAKWAKEHGKVIVFAEGLGGTGRLVFDFSQRIDPTSELMLFLFAFSAQVESQNIKDRVLSAQAAMRTMEFRFRGGHTGYGYMKAPLDGGGWTLVQDPVAVEIIYRIISELIEKKSVSEIAYRLTCDRIPNPTAHEKLRKLDSESGEAKAILAKLRPWAPSVIKKLLTSEKLLGWKLHKGRPVRDANGAPILSTREPILTREEFDQIGAILDHRSTNPVERRDTNAELMRVVLCVGCGGRMYLQQINPETGDGHYKCNSQARGTRCKEAPIIKSIWVEAYVAREFLRLVGSIEFTKIIKTPGYDPAPELAATLAEYQEHRKLQAGLKSNAARADWQATHDALDNRLAELETAEKVEPTIKRVSTGRTIAHEWKEADKAGRRRILQESGAVVLVRKGKPGRWRKLDESRVMFLIHGDLEPLAGEAGDPAEDTGTRPVPVGRLRIATPDGAYELPSRQTLKTAA
ncbi:recombinase family protein [Kitasatospora xanthocidica]|uniref:recombinase family protein n=1 Tax=Kitasatospora xanthocidica TaxID=83382 RepID=UPI0036E42EDA